jgi:hypothetical protein
MGAQGTTTIDFGAFPGKSDASVAVTGQAGILAGSLVEAWLVPVATADHSADEHMLETIKIFAGNIVPGTGFTVYAINPDKNISGRQDAGRGLADRGYGGGDTRIYGQWSIGWVWN